MNACTAIAKLNNKLIGDPLDVVMFNFTNWKLEEPQQISGNQNVI